MQGLTFDADDDQSQYNHFVDSGISNNPWHHPRCVISFKRPCVVAIGGLSWHSLDRAKTALCLTAQAAIFTLEHPSGGATRSVSPVTVSASG